jgi:hypothetical protein
MAELVLDLGVTVVLVILGVQVNRDLPVEQEENERVLFKFNSAKECRVRKRNWWLKSHVTNRLEGLEVIQKSKGH